MYCSIYLYVFLISSFVVPVPEERVVNIVFGNGIWMLSGAPGTLLDYSIYFSSDNTKTWNTKTPPTPAQYTAPTVVYGNGIFVILSGNSTMTTTDTKTWTTTPAPSDCQYIQYVGNVSGLFFCGKGLRPASSVSKDGTTWSDLSFPPSPPSGISSFILFDGNQYLVTFVYNDFMYSSADGINWSQTDAISYLGLEYSAFNGKVGVVGGNLNNEVYVTI